MSNEMFTQLPTVPNSTIADIIAAVQGGVSVQQTLGQVFALFLSNTVLNYPGNPNGNLAGVLNQFCYDTVDMLLYICTTAGTAIDAVWSPAGDVNVPVPLSEGGTGADLTGSNGGIVYSNATTFGILAGTATAGQMLRSGALGAPSWSTAVYPASTAINQLLYSSANNVITGLSTAVNGVLITDNTTGIPYISQTLPAAVQGNITALGTIATGVWHGTVIGSTYGGTGVNNGANTITTAGNVNFAGAFTTAGAFTVTQTYTGATNVTFPTTGTLATTSQIPSLPLSMSNGGTGASLTAAAGSIVYSGASAMALLAPSAVNQSMVWGNGTAAPTFAPYSMPATVSANGLLLATSSTVVSQLAPVNNALLISGVSGVPSWLAMGISGSILQSGTTPGWTGYSMPSSPLVANELLFATSTTAIAQLTTANNSVLVTSNTGVPSFSTTLPSAVQVAVGSLNSGTGASGSTFWRGDGTWSAPSGSGTVNSGSTGQIAFYASNGTAVSGESLVSLSQGGTNAGLTASNGGIVYSTASAFGILAGTATAGLTLLSGATGAPTWSTNKPITKINVVTFTTSGTYTPSSGLQYSIAKGVAGGGAGGGSSISGTATSTGGGGGAGSYGEGLYTAATIGASQSVTIGAGGVAVNGAAGGNGGNTLFGTAGALLACNGGGGGGTSINLPVAFGGASGAIGTGGYLNLAGGPGGLGSTTGSSSLVGFYAAGGVGGNSRFGYGGNSPFITATTSSANGNVGVGFGSGGSGSCYEGNTGTATGGNGAPGYLVIIEFISI